MLANTYWALSMCQALYHELHRVITKNLASLYTSAKLNPRDRVMGEVGKDTFVALPVKGRRHTRFLPWKTVSQPQRTRWEFLWHWVKDSVSDNIRVWAGLVSAIIYFCFIVYAKVFDCVDHKKLWKILKEMGIPETTWPASWETCLQVRKLLFPGLTVLGWKDNF